MMTSDAILERGIALLQEGATDDALALLAGELDMPAESADVQHAAAMLAVGIADYPLAEALLRKAIAAAPPRAHHLNDLGAVLFQHGQACQAAEAFAHALQLDASHESAQANLAEVQLHMRRTRRALSTIVCSNRTAALSAPLPDEWSDLPAPLLTLCAALRAAEGGNYPSALALMQHWLSSDTCAWQLNLLVAESSGALSLSMTAQADAEVSGASREQFLFDMALRVAPAALALVAAAALTRHWLALHQTTAVQRLERLFLEAWPEQASLLQHMRHCRLPGLAACGTGRRQPFVLIGTCIAEGVRYFLNCSEAFHSRYALQHFITNRAARSMSEFVIDDVVLHEAAVLAHVHPAWADWSNEQAYVDLLARVPAHVQRISFPYPVFQPLWPFHSRDVRQGGDLPQAFWGPFESRPYYPYGDSRALGLLRECGDVDAAISKYLNFDFAAAMDLDRLLDKSLEIMRGKEALTDVKIVDFIADNFRRTRLFDTVNHVSNAAALYIANQILSRLDLPMLDQRCLARVSDVLSPQMPIHPGVIRHFGLQYCTEDTRYRVDEHRHLNYAEYLRDYLQFV